LGILRGYVI